MWRVFPCSLCAVWSGKETFYLPCQQLQYPCGWHGKDTAPLQFVWLDTATCWIFPLLISLFLSFYFIFLSPSSKEVFIVVFWYERVFFFPFPVDSHFLVSTALSLHPAPFLHASSQVAKGESPVFPLWGSSLGLEVQVIIHQKDKALLGAGESELSVSMLLLKFLPVCLPRSLLIWEVCTPLPLFQSPEWRELKFRAGRSN